MFPNHIPNPEDKTAMKAITQAVLENKADLGIIFDTDVDRYFNHPNLSNHIAHSCISSFFNVKSFTVDLLLLIPLVVSSTGIV